jgi:hypothetical protein
MMVINLNRLAHYEGTALDDRPEGKHHENRVTGRKVRPITDVTSTALRKEEMAIGSNSLKEEAVWRVDPLLYKDLETDIETTAVTMQQRDKYVSKTIELPLEILLCNTLSTVSL